MRSFDAMEAFLAMEGWTVPLVIVPAGLLMVSVHPQPMEDCPCFEDGEWWNQSRQSQGSHVMSKTLPSLSSFL